MDGVVSIFDQLTPTARYGVQVGGPSRDARSYPMTSLAGSAGPSPDMGSVDHNKPYKPQHPLFWAGLLLAGTFGLIFFSTTVRVGPVRAGAAIGKS